MCFYTSDLACKIAKKPITVYKVILRYNYSHIMRFKYNKNRINNKVELFPTLTDIANTINYRINKGYHSFKSIEISLKHAYNYNNPNDLINEDIKISKFIIPKGSIYYENGYSIVSSNIIYKSDVSLIRIKLFHYKLYKEIKQYCKNINN